MTHLLQDHRDIPGDNCTMEKDVTHFESDCPLKGMISACPFRASNVPNWPVVGQFGAVDTI